jgi:hypothetical protein
VKERVFAKILVIKRSATPVVQGCFLVFVDEYENISANGCMDGLPRSGGASRGAAQKTGC